MFNITDIFSIVLSLAILLMLVSFLILRFTLTRHIRKVATSDPESWFDDDHYLGITNTAYSMGACAAPRVKHLKNYDRYMPTNIDVRMNAKPYEIVFSYIMAWSVGILVACMFIYHITDFFGWVEWEFNNT